MELVRQRPQRLHQQAQRVDLDRQLAGLGAHQRTLGGDDVADVPALEGIVRRAQGRALQEQLHAPTHVLHGGERGLAHHPLGQQATGDGDLAAAGFQRFAGPGVGVGVIGLQVAGEITATEIIGEGDALPAQRGQLGAAFGDQVVFVDVRGGVDIGHGIASLYSSPCLQGEVGRGSGGARQQREVPTPPQPFPACRGGRNITPHRCVSNRPPAPISGWLPRSRRDRRPAPSGYRCVRCRCADP